MNVVRFLFMFTSLMFLGGGGGNVGPKEKRLSFHTDQQGN
jgi:hypothetical protein